MLEYIYFVKCPGCEDEHFGFFNDAKEFAMSCLSQKPVITQIEVNRNDFGECVDSCDLGTVWSWEEMMADVPVEPELTTVSKAATLERDRCSDPEFDALDNALDSVPDNFRKPVPAGMTVEALVEEMEENEDTVECKWCDELFDKSECRYEVDMGWLCSNCQQAIKSRGETLSFRESALSEATEAFDVSKAICDVLEEASNNITDENQSKVIKKLLDNVSPEKLDDAWSSIKGMLEDRPLKEEDKDALVRKLNIDRDLLDKVDSVLAAVDAVLRVAPAAAGILWDVLELSPLDEVALGTPTGGWGAVVAAILSVIPDKLIISALVSIEIHIGRKIADALKNIIIHKIIPEPDKKLNESINNGDFVTLEYKDMAVDIVTRVIPATRWDPEDYEEEEVIKDFDYEVETDDIADTIWENFITEEDAKDVPGGLDALEDEDTWNNFLETHLDDLITKYYNQLLAHYRAAAEEAAREKFQDDYEELCSEGPDPDRAYDEWRDSQYFDEGCETRKSFLEEFDDAEEHKANLVDCPECGTHSYDMKEQYCTNCGLNL